MKTLIVAVMLLLVRLGLPAQVPNFAREAEGANSAIVPVTPYAAIYRDANSCIWEETNFEKFPSEEMPPRAHRYMELATGLHYLKDGEWLKSQENIEIQPQGGAAAIHGQHQVYFPYDIYDGVIEMVTPDGQHLKSRPLEIAYSDGTRSIMIAELKHSIGQILPSGNQVIYTNAFTEFAADLVCTYRKSGFESDLIFREQPPAPEVFGLASQTSRLELLTEFFDTPEPRQTSLPREGSSAVHPPGERIVDLENLPDVTLKFGSMTMVRGKAFSVNSGGPDESLPANIAGFPGVRGRLAVGKTWTRIEGRTLLIEAVPVVGMNSRLKGLPISNASSATASASREALPRITARRFLPPLRIVRHIAKSIPMAKAEITQKPGFVLDYLMINSDQTDFTFKGDTTYYVSAGVNFSGNVVIEGGSVIKFPANSNAFIYVNGGTITCKTSPYRPAIFTSRDDNSVGDIITGSSGSPVVGDYACLAAGSTAVNIHDLRMSYGYWGAYLASGDATLRDLQILHSQIGVQFFESTHCSVRNVLMSDIRGYAFEAYDTSVDLEHMTLDQCSQFGYNDWNSSLQVTNCIFTGVQIMPPGGGSNIPYVSNSVAVATTNTGIFQSAGAGNYYLATNSPYRNIGSTNINSLCLNELGQKTTYPPILYSNVVVSANTTLNPQAQRDYDAPDLGYHYDPIDYLVDYFWVTNATLTVTNGTVLAGYYDQDVLITGGSAIVSIGTPLQPNWFTRYSSVQEQSVALGGGGAVQGSTVMVNPWHTTNAPTGLFRFTKFSCSAGDGYHIYHNQFNWAYSNLLVQDCEFWGGKSDFSGYYNTPETLKNNLFSRSGISAAATTYTNNSLSVSNNLFWNNTVFLSSFANSNLWHFFNNSFDHSTNNFGFGIQNFANGYNAYIGDTNVSKRLMPIGSGDVILTNFSYQSGQLGDFYQPTNSSLINTGSCAANFTPLYYYTTQTNGVFETNTVVDIGYHYMGRGTDGLPYDSDLDGMPDAWERAYFGDVSQPPDGDYDSDGISNNSEYVNGTDPNTVKFSIDLDNSHVKTNLATLHLNVTNGVASGIAILIDSTNYPTATWSNLVSTNVTVNLGVSDGWHQVVIGLRGRLTNSVQTWKSTYLYLDRVLPTIGITNPVAGSTVYEALNQLQGWVSEPARSVTFDVINFAGAVSNQTAVIGQQDSQYAKLGIGTNYFQGYDVWLAEGSNHITVHATDLAGNVTTTNLYVFLDFSGATNSPPLQIVWPQNGTFVSGTNITILAQTTNASIFVVATNVVVGTNTVTNTVFGLVERNGKVWIEGLPVGSGTNVISITATDLSGNTTSTNITVIDFPSALSIDDIQSTNLTQMTVSNVSGTIGVTNYTVWVNGVKATNNGNGTWDAFYVPIDNSGTAALIASAIPNSDNGGNGTPSGQPMANPISTNSIQVLYEKDRPPLVYVATFDGTYLETGSTWTTSPHATNNLINSDDVHFTSAFISNDCRGGVMVQKVTELVSGGISGSTNLYHWLPSTGVGAEPYISTNITFVNGSFSTVISTNYGPVERINANLPPTVTCPIFWSETNSWSGGSGGSGFVRNAQWNYETHLHLLTGGKAVPGIQKLIEIDASATQFSNPTPTGDSPYTVACDTQQLPANAINIMGSTLLSNGKIGILLPDGADLDITPNILGAIGPIGGTTPGGVSVTVSASPQAPGSVTVSISAGPNAFSTGFVPSSCLRENTTDTTYGETGYFELTRTGDTVRPLAVRVGINGTAERTVHYDTDLAGGPPTSGVWNGAYTYYGLNPGYWVYFAPNQTTARITIFPTYYPFNFVDKTVVVTILPDGVPAVGTQPPNSQPFYTIDQNQATLHVIDSDVDVYDPGITMSATFTKGMTNTITGLVHREDYDPITQVGTDVGCGTYTGSACLVTKAVYGVDFTVYSDPVPTVLTRGPYTIYNPNTKQNEPWYVYNILTSIYIGSHLPYYTISAITTPTNQLVVLPHSGSSPVQTNIAYIHFYAFDPISEVRYRDYPRRVRVNEIMSPWFFWIESN